MRQAASVHICALDDREGPAREVAADYGIPWTCIKTPWANGRLENAFSLVRVASGLRRLRPDIVLSATNLPNVVCGLTWWATGASLSVWNQHDVLGTTRINQRLFRRALQTSPLVVTGADHARNWLIERLGAEPDRVYVVRDKVELAPPRESGATWRARLDLSARTWSDAWWVISIPARTTRHCCALGASSSIGRPKGRARCSFSPAATREAATQRRRLPTISTYATTCDSRVK